MLVPLILSAFAGPPTGINNPGGDRIPYVKLQSGDWDIVLRMTGEGNARVERMKARCKADLWVNGCAPGVDPELRQIAMNGAFRDAVKASGDFSYCSTAVLSGIPADLARGVVRAAPDRFCQVFLDPESVRDQRSGNATQGENDLLNRLMGGKGTTSGTLRMKTPPTRQGTPAGGEREATGERRTARRTSNNRRKPTEASPPETTSEQGAFTPPRIPAAATSSGLNDDDDWFVPPPREAAQEDELRTSTPERMAVADPALTRQGGGSSAVQGEVAAPSITRGQDLLANEDSMDDIFQPPPPDPVRKPDPVLDELLAPNPDVPPKDQVVVPAPKPEPRRKTEFERLEAENAALANLARSNAEEDDDEGKKKGRKKKKDEEETVVIGSDEDFGDYIIIDIESLPDE